MPDLYAPPGIERQRLLVSLLYQARTEAPEPPADWDGLVRRALQYGRAAWPRLKPSEFETLRLMTVGQLFGAPQ